MSLGNTHPTPETLQNSFAVRLRSTKHTSLGGQGTISATNPPTSDNIVLSSKCPLIGIGGKELMPSRDVNLIGQRYIPA